MSLRAVLRLRVPAAQAKPSPTIGQAMGPLGLNMMDFCKQFNAKTAHLRDGIPVNVVLNAYGNRTFDFETKLPATTWFLKQCAGIEKGAQSPGREFCGIVSLKQLYEVIQIKRPDFPKAQTDREIMTQLLGSCKSIGLLVVKDLPGEVYSRDVRLYLEELHRVQEEKKTTSGEREYTRDEVISQLGYGSESESDGEDDE